ncbi:MAG: hypothetical protein EBS19_11060 [Spirochaetia bacterium]|nr:hypothetical protein [Spirochaetia bacterium]
MSIKIYSGYDEFKYEEPELCNLIGLDDVSSHEEEFTEEESDDIFFYNSKSQYFIDFSAFYIVSDLEDEENAEDISGYLGKFKRIYVADLHKVLFYVI